MNAFLWCVFAYFGLMLLMDFVVARVEGAKWADICVMALHLGMLGGATYWLAVN